MKLASYVGTRKGFMGIGNVLIRLRLGGSESHTEIMFEPGDGVDEYMPDLTCEPDENGAYWHFSSVGLERMPPWSRRAGKLGGARFKRIVPEDKWIYDQMDTDPLKAAKLAKELDGTLYDWQAVIRYVFWILPTKLARGMCSEICARLAGIPKEEAHLFDPRTIRAMVRGFKCKH